MLMSLSLKKPQRRSPRRSIALAVAFVLMLSGLVTLGASSASALQIDCVYGGQALRDYIGAGRDGVTCAGTSAAGPDTVHGKDEIDPWDAHGAGGGSTTTGCKYLPPYSGEDIDYDRVQSSPLPGDGWTYPSGSHTTYWRGSGDNARIVATRDIVAQGFMFRVRLTDYSFYSPFGGGYISQSSFQCETEGWNISVVSMAPGAPLTLPDGTATPASEKVDTVSSLRPIPGRVGEYFLRVDVKNTRSVTTPVAITIQKGSFTNFAVIAFPSYGACLDAPGMGMECTVDGLPSGISTTFLFTVKVKDRATPKPYVDILTTWMGNAAHAGTTRFSMLNSMSTTSTD